MEVDAPPARSGPRPVGVHDPCPSLACPNMFACWVRSVSWASPAISGQLWMRAL